MVFIKNGYVLNFILVLIVSPIIIYMFVKENRAYKLKITTKYQIEIYLNKMVVSYTDKIYFE